MHAVFHSVAAIELFWVLPPRIGGNCSLPAKNWRDFSSRQFLAANASISAGITVRVSTTTAADLKNGCQAHAIYRNGVSTTAVKLWLVTLRQDIVQRFA